MQFRTPLKHRCKFSYQTNYSNFSNEMKKRTIILMHVQNYTLNKHSKALNCKQSHPASFRNRVLLNIKGEISIHTRV